MSKIRAQKNIKKAALEINAGNYEEAAGLCVWAIRDAKRSEAYALAGKAFALILSIEASGIRIAGNLKCSLNEASHRMAN
jgi:hypothetical protein